MRLWHGWFAFAISCTSDEALVNDAVEAVEVAEGVMLSPGPRSNQFVLDVTLDEPDAVAVLCQADHDAEEQIFVESEFAATAQQLRLSALRPSSTYQCRVTTLGGGLVAGPFEVEAGPPPVPFTPMQTTVDPELGMSGEWTLLVRPGAEADNPRAWLAIYDAEGLARWWHQLPRDYTAIEALFHPEDGTIVWGGGDRRQKDGYPGVVSLWEGDERVEVPGWDVLRFHHDGARLDDGRFLTLEAVQNGLDGVTWEGFMARVYDPVDAEVDFVFHSQQYVDSGELEPPDDFFDPYHANWVDYLQTDDGPVMYVSLCHTWSLLAIDGTTGDPRWHLRRDAGWTVLDESGEEIGDDALPQCQHGVEVEGDRFWMYDNGQGRDHSSAVLWQIDGENLVAQRLWSWTEEGWHDHALGDIDVLADGERVLVTQSRTGGDDGHTELVEVDVATGRVASRQEFLVNGRGYRAERIEGCELFDRVDRCPALRERLDSVAELFVP